MTDSTVARTEPEPEREPQPRGPEVPDTRDHPPAPVRFDRKSVLQSGLVLAAVGVGVILSLWLFAVTSHFWFLMMLAWLFAIALEPGIRKLISHGRSRGFAAVLMGGSAVIVAIGLAIVFGQLFFQQSEQMVVAFPSFVQSLVDWVNSTFGTSLDAAAISSKLSIGPAQMASVAESLAGGVLGILGSLVSVLFDLVTVLVFGFYFAADGPRFYRSLAALMPQRAQRVFVNVSEIAIAKTGRYVVSKIILAGLSALFHGVFFFLIDVPYWLPFALFVGITAQFVPIVGTYLGIILPVLATVFDTPLKAVAIIIFATIYQQIETYLWTPRVSRRTMDVNPAVALGAVFVGGAVWGPLGAIIGIPLAAAAVAVIDTYKSRYALVPELAHGRQRDAIEVEPEP